VENWLGEPSRMYRAWAFQNSQSRLFVTRNEIFVVPAVEKVRGTSLSAPLLWKCCKFRSKLLCVRTEALTHTARWHILLFAVFCLLAILPFGYAQSITELKSKAEDGDVQAHQGV